MENKKALEAGALVSKFTYAVKNQINNFFPNGIMTSSVVVGSIFLSSDELFRMEQLPVSTSADFIWKKKQDFSSKCSEN